MIIDNKINYTEQIRVDQSASAPRGFTPVASGSHYEVYANGSLLVKSTEENDAGYYLCQSSNGIGPGLSKVINLYVHSELFKYSR